MMKRSYPNEFIYQMFVLLLAFILVHAFYVTLVRPEAQRFL